MKKIFVTGLVIASATLFSCGTSGTTDTDKDSVHAGDTTSGSMTSDSGTTAMTTDTAKKMTAGPVSAMDKQFMMEAAAGGNTEVEASRVALNMSSNDRVKSYANMMISDHTKAGDELKSIASAKSVTLPDSVMAKQHSALNMLRNTPAKNFDKVYIAMMDKDHKETIAKFEMAAQKCDDSDVKAFASKTLPALKMHEDSVKAIMTSMK